jgi:hypothetical protein
MSNLFIFPDFKEQKHHQRSQASNPFLVNTSFFKFDTSVEAVRQSTSMHNPVDFEQSHSKLDQTHNFQAQTWPDTNSASLDQIINCTPLSNMRRVMQQEHPTLNNHNKEQILNEFLSEMKLSIPKDKRLISQINEPVLEILRVFIEEMKQGIKLPNKNDLICATTATANSGHENEAVIALQLIGRNPNENSTILGTVTESGRTGVSNVNPKHNSVRYNQHAQINEWPQVSDALFTQLCAYSQTSKYETIYHWGCISQNWQLSPANRYVSSWQLHEHWNILFTMAMMRHALKTLQLHGRLYLKIRIFKNAETLGLTTLLAHAFEEFRLISNYRQQCTFVVFVGYRFLGEKHINVTEITEQLEKCKEYTAESIFINPIIQRPRSSVILSNCTQVKQEMLQNKCRIYTAYIYSLRLIEQYLKTPDDRIWKTLEQYLNQMYANPETVEAIVKYAKSAEIHLRETDKGKMFLSIMETPWMLENG